MSNQTPSVEVRCSKKRARRERIRANHERLRGLYGAFVLQHGNVLTYAQWLHPQMREPY